MEIGVLITIRLIKPSVLRPSDYAEESRSTVFRCG